MKPENIAQLSLQELIKLDLARLIFINTIHQSLDLYFTLSNSQCK